MLSMDRSRSGDRVRVHGSYNRNYRSYDATQIEKLSCDKGYEPIAFNEGQAIIVGLALPSGPLRTSKTAVTTSAIGPKRTNLAGPTMSADWGRSEASGVAS